MAKRLYCLMISFFFSLYITACLWYLFWSPRKEIPLVIVLHALLQYVLTLALWLFYMDSRMTGLLLGYMAATTLLLIWGRQLTYSRELISIRVFFRLTQWVILGGLLIFVLFQNPYVFMEPSEQWAGRLNFQHLTFHPLLKLAGNVLAFTSFFHVILHWGQAWSLRKTWLDLGPLVGYILLMMGVRYLSGDPGPQPFS
ncbi:MAG: hypothetical protein SF053_13960 [Bacteroidia bacterium]|nr:hypothetical protein [Bacteroidia bacterium]